MEFRIENESPVQKISKNELLVHFKAINNVLDNLISNNFKIVEFKGIVQHQNGKYELIGKFGFGANATVSTNQNDIAKCEMQVEKDKEFLKQEDKLKELKKFYYIKLLNKFSIMDKPLSLFLRISTIIVGLLFVFFAVLMNLTLGKNDWMNFILGTILGLSFLHSGITGRKIIFIDDDRLFRFFVKKDVKSALKRGNLSD